MNIYCISLGRAAERRAHIEESFSSETITFVKAVDGLRYSKSDAVDDRGHTEWKPKSREKLIAEGVLLRDSKLPPTHLACNMSHIKALNLFLKSKESWCVILEDDVTPTKYLIRAWKEGKKLDDLVEFPPGCDMLYMCDSGSGAHMFTTADVEGSVRSVHTLMGYAITRRGAMAAVSAATPMRWLLDFQFAACCFPKHKFDKEKLPVELKGKETIKALVPRHIGWVKHSFLADSSFLGHDVNSISHPTNRRRAINRKYLELSKRFRDSRTASMEAKKGRRARVKEEQ